MNFRITMNKLDIASLNPVIIITVGKENSVHVELKRKLIICQNI